MTQSQNSGEEVAHLGYTLYADQIRDVVETEENIGKMIVIDVESGDYEIADVGMEASA